MKPNTGGDRAVRIGSPSPGRFHAENVWLRFLVQTAWNVKDFQVSGGPAWAASDRFNIDATTDSAATFDQMRPMLQKLLEDRFQMTLHRESKEFPVYELVVAKGGSKLPVSKEGSCVPRAATPQPPVPGQPKPNYCGMAEWGPRGLSGNSISTQQLAATLANILQRPVIDKTGLTAAFDAHLKWTADQTTPGLMAPDLPLPAEPSADPGPTVFTVLQELLGLKLQAAKGTVEVLVIDRAEKPSAN